MLETSCKDNTFRWDKGRAFRPALSGVLGLRHGMAEQDIAKPQKAHTIQVEVYLHTTSNISHAYLAEHRTGEGWSTEA